MLDISSKLYIYREELRQEGLSAHQIRQLIAMYDLVPVNRGCLMNPNCTGEKSSLLAVSAYAPKGVVCLVSAAIYHGLIASEYSQIDVALPRRSRVPVSPNDPQMRFYLFSEARYGTGIKTVKIGGNSFKIYDKEKTICDLLFYRNKIGFDLMMGALKEYLKSETRDVNKLMEYAKELRCGKLMYEYLEVLL